MEPAAVEQLSAWAGGQPVRSDAQFCGWTRRNRLYWLGSVRKSLSPATAEPPHDWAWFQDAAAFPELRFVGDKPLPKTMQWQQGFTPLTTPRAVMKGEALPFFTFTPEFYHPTDADASEPPEVMDRFLCDNRRFPLPAYRECSLVWKQEHWRQPLPEERAQMLGVPSSIVGGLVKDEPKRRQVHNSILGNGSHIFTMMAILAMLPSLCSAKFLPPSLRPDAELRARIAGTPWDPTKRAAFPGLYDAAGLVKDMKAQFCELNVPPSIWKAVEHRLTFCDLPLMQLHVVFVRGRGEVWHELGPSSLDRRSRARVFTSLSGQRYPSDTAKGLDFLLPPGLGKEAHIAQSLQLPSPFEPQSWPEADLLLPIHALQLWREFFPCLAQRQRDVVRALRRALEPLDQALWPFRSESSQRVASSKSPAFAACMVSLLRWPDRDIGMSLVRGFSIVGEISSSGLFRPVPVKETPPTLQQWLSAEAAESVEAIIRSPPPKMHQEILAVTLDEISKGFCSPLKTKAEMDDIFGVAQWRPLERFVLNQHGKMRVIDNARKTHHNAHASLAETIWTSSVDFVPAVIRDILSALCPQGPAPEWLRFRVGTEDLPDAYRGLPVSTEHLAVSVASVFVPGEGWRFTVLWDLAYGLEAAVVAFNRFPCLGIAVARRCCSAFASAYFDDQLALEAVSTSDLSRQGILCSFTCMGAPPQKPKSFPPTADRPYLGVSLHVGDASLDRWMFMQCKQSTKHKVSAKLDSILAANALSRDDASKLRGDVQWLFSSCAGNAAKYAGPLLRQAQLEGRPSLLDEERVVLQCLRHMVLCAKPKVISLEPHAGPFSVIYTDASFEGGELRLGWVIFQPSPRAPLAGTCLVPQAAIEEWKPRKQQIFAGETLAVLILPLLYPQVLCSTDALWYVDNQGAVSAAVKGCSNEGDIHEIAHFAAILRFQLSLRTFFEWIDSDSNPSDELSRLGLHCEWSKQQGWQLSEFDFPPEAYRSSLQLRLRDVF